MGERNRREESKRIIGGEGEVEVVVVVRSNTDDAAEELITVTAVQGGLRAVNNTSLSTAGTHSQIIQSESEIHGTDQIL